MTANVEVIVGTYEEFLLGYRLDIKDEQQVLVQSFADKSHAGALKSVSVKGHWIASGASDDRIFLYDMRSRKQSQIILTHEGTVNALAFTPDQTHLLSGADDGRLICTRLNSWCTEANWKAHNGQPVTHVSCHPSGKLALSLGGDLVLRTWNLVKGRVAYKTNLKSRGTLGHVPDCLSWSPTGDYFTLSGQRLVEFWSIKLADVAQSQKTNSKPVSVCWIAEKTCLIGQEDGKILWVTMEVETEEQVLIEAHDARVKAMCFHKGNLVTVSSAGELKLWLVNESHKKLKKVAAVNLGCRPTCLGILDLDQFGSDYVLSPKIAAATAEEPPKIVAKRPQPKQSLSRVTIEYDTNDQQAKNEIDDSEENDEAEESDKEDEAAAAESEDEEDSVSESDETTEIDTADESDEDKPQFVATSRKRQRPAAAGFKPSPKQAKLPKTQNKNKQQQQKTVPPTPARKKLTPKTKNK